MLLFQTFFLIKIYEHRLKHLKQQDYIKLMGTIGGLKILEIRKQDFKLQNVKCSYKAHYETLQKVKKQH